MAMKREVEITNEDLIKAASLRFCRHFPALNKVNQLAGEKSAAWEVARMPVKDIVRELDDRNIDVSEIKTSMHDCDCCHSFVSESVLYKNHKLFLGIEKAGDSPIIM